MILRTRLLNCCDAIVVLRWWWRWWWGTCQGRAFVDVREYESDSFETGPTNGPNRLVREQYTLHKRGPNRVSVVCGSEHDGEGSTEKQGQMHGWSHDRIHKRALVRVHNHVAVKKRRWTFVHAEFTHDVVQLPVAVATHACGHVCCIAHARHTVLLG
jgi:hypothetical protein